MAGLLASLAFGLPEGAEAARKKARKSKSGTRRQRGTGSATRSNGGGSAYYRNCSEARAAGAAPVREGDPGYSRKLDRDGDGVGCE